MRTPFLAALLGAALTTPALAQLKPTTVSTCPKENHGRGYCEERTYALPAAAELRIDAAQMGGISVVGTNDKTIEVKAQVQADSRELAGAVQVDFRDGWLRATSPNDRKEGERGYAVSYEVRVPHAIALELKALNGGIVLRNVDGRAQFETTNGGVVLENVNGDIKGRTINGGLVVKLNGRKWEGKGLDVETTNGGIVWEVPANYSARLSSRTVHGGVTNQFAPATAPKPKEGWPKMGGEVELTLDKGGAPLRAVTTNGGIMVKKS